MPSSWCAISRPRKRSVTLTLSPSSKKRFIGLHLDVVVVVVDVRAELDLLDLDDLLVLAGLGRLLLLVELVFAVIQDLADRRARIRAPPRPGRARPPRPASSASNVGITPRFEPVWSISCTSRMRISRLTRGPSLGGTGNGFIGRRMVGVSSSCCGSYRNRSCRRGFGLCRRPDRNRSCRRGFGLVAGLIVTGLAVAGSVSVAGQPVLGVGGTGTRPIPRRVKIVTLPCEVNSG